MTFADLVSKVKEETGTDLSKMAIAGLLETAFGIIQGELIQEERVNLSSFGVIKTKRTAGRQVVPPRGIEPVTIGPKIKIVFLPGKNFREILARKAA